MGASGTMLAEQRDHAALAEIELCGELMIAAAAVRGERLSLARIDEVLEVRPRRTTLRLPVQGQRVMPSQAGRLPAR